MDTELIHWGWFALILGLMLACWTLAVAAGFYVKGVEHGRREGYNFAKIPGHEDFRGVAYSLTRVITIGDYKAWRDSLEIEDLL